MLANQDLELTEQEKEMLPVIRSILTSPLLVDAPPAEIAATILRALRRADNATASGNDKMQELAQNGDPNAARYLDREWAYRESLRHRQEHISPNTPVTTKA